MKAIRIAWIGNRHGHARPNFQTVMAHPETFTLVGAAEIVPEIDPELYRDAPRCTVEELLRRDDIEGVIVEAGKEYGVAYAQLFAERGIPVFLDKPGSSDISRYTRFLRTAEEKGLPVEIGYMYRYNPMVRHARELAESGALGEIFSIEAHMSVRHDTAQRRDELGRYKGGSLFVLGCHLIDLTCSFMGFPQEILPLSVSTGNEGLSTEDLGCAVLRYKNGSAYVKSCYSEYNGFDRRQLVICGTKGTVEIRPLEVYVPGGHVSKAKITLSEENPYLWSDGGREMTSPVYHRYYPMLHHFAEMVRGTATMLHSYEYEARLFSTIVQACGGEDELFLPRL